jgi:hypothetical protein
MSAARAGSSRPCGQKSRKLAFCFGFTRAPAFLTHDAGI